MCSDTRFVIDPAGQVAPCPSCGAVDYAAQSGLSGDELATTADSITGKEAIHRMLRWLVGEMVERPTGWITLWGSYGTAKTLAVQAMVAGLVRKGVQARFYHAKRLEQGWFDDIHGDSSNGHMYRRLRVLAIDEADKINTKSDWTRAAFQELMDDRYRSGLAGKTCTIIVTQHDPEQCMPGDVASRMADGRFYRAWKYKANSFTIERWGDLWVPGIMRVQGQDMRPQMRPKM
jgi:DNA replication protein DnaC